MYSGGVSKLRAVVGKEGGICHILDEMTCFLKHNLEFGKAFVAWMVWQWREISI